MSRILLLLVLALSLAACRGSAMKAYQGPEQSQSQLAVVANAWGCPGCLIYVRNGREVYYDARRDGIRSSVTLQPGLYDVAYGHAAYNTASVSRSDRIELKAGHTYVVHYDVCYGFCFSMPSYTTFVWIEDGASGEVVSGTRP